MLINAVAVDRTIVIMDRYVLSSYVYQGVSPDTTSIVSALNNKFPAPNITFVVHCDEASLRRRTEERGADQMDRAGRTLEHFSRHVNGSGAYEEWALNGTQLIAGCREHYFVDNSDAKDPLQDMVRVIVRQIRKANEVSQ